MAESSIGVVYIEVAPSGKDFGKKLEGDIIQAVDNAAKTGGTSILGKFGGAFGKIGKIGLGAIGTITGGITALAAKGGFQRALAIENAQAKLKGLGHDSKSIAEIMNNALASVKGTAFGLGDAATVAATLSAAGIKSGDQMTNVLKTVADTAQISGRSLTDIGTIFSSVAARGKLQGDDMLQLMSSGVPVLQLLAKHLGKTSEEVSDMVSKGQIDFQTFADSMQEGLGGAALAAGDTFQGALANVKAALGRLGEGPGKLALESLRKAFNAAIPAIDALSGQLTPFLDKLNGQLDPYIDKAIGLIERFANGLQDGSITIQDIVGQVGQLAGAFALFAGVGGNVDKITNVFDTLGKIGDGGFGQLTGKLKQMPGQLQSSLTGLHQFKSYFNKDLRDALAVDGDPFANALNRITHRPVQIVRLENRRHRHRPIRHRMGVKTHQRIHGARRQSQDGGHASPIRSGRHIRRSGRHRGTEGAGRPRQDRRHVRQLLQPGQLPEVPRHRRHHRRPGRGTGHARPEHGRAIVRADQQPVRGTAHHDHGRHGEDFRRAAGHDPDWVEHPACPDQRRDREPAAARLGRRADREQLVQGLAQALPTLLPAAVQMITTLITALIEQAPMLIQSGMQLLQGLVQGIMNSLPTLIAAIPQILQALLDAFTTALPTVLNIGVDIILNIVNGLVSAMPQLVAMLPTVIQTLISTLTSNLPGIVQVGVNALVKLIDGLSQAIPQLVGYIPQIIASIVNTLASNLPQILQAGAQIIITLAGGLAKAIPQLISQIPAIVRSIWNGFTSVNWGEVGLNIITGIASGIAGAAGKLVDAAVNAAKDALNWVKDKLGIHSPSRVFRDQVGVMIGRGMAVGIDRS